MSLATLCPSELIFNLAQMVVLIVVLCLPARLGQSAPQQNSRTFRVGGTIRDQTGAFVAGAEVSLRSKGFAATQTTSKEGRFTFDAVADETGTLVVRASGFATQEQGWNAWEAGAAYLEIVLRPASVLERVTVTATRTELPIRDTPASVRVLSPEDLSATAALTLDDVLRQVPGFSLFRRSDSRTANPTSQGVSLRGVGASGASRARVLNDGIPLNDPFGGWVYWDRVPRESVQSIEVVQGGASDLYGTDAMGGVINFIPRQVTNSALAFEASYGNEMTPDASLSATARAGRWAGQLSADAFHTDGYILVDPSQRGPVDTAAGSDYSDLSLRLTRTISDRARAFLGGSIFGESRKNGKPLEGNRTHIRELTLGGDWQTQALGSFSLRAYGGPQVYDQDFFAVAPNRLSETLTRVQRVPAQQIGATAQWSRTAGSRQTLVGGLEAREVRGASNELIFVPGQLTSAVGAGGRERTWGLFGEDTIRPAQRWIITAGARLDDWRNYDALSTTRPLTKPGLLQVTNFADRTERAFNPRLSVLHKLTENISLAASAYRAFRAPTLNELYRSFRLGNILTLANQNLRAERLTGAEAGASFAAFKQKLTARGTFFWSDITRPVANVTLNVLPTLITRERENLGRTRSRGFELAVDAYLTDAVAVSGGYQFADARVLNFPADRTLEGLFIPQVPRNQLTFQVRYSKRSWITLGLQGRAVGAQYDDDQNKLRLNRYFTMDAIVSHSLARGVEAFVAGENLLNQRYDIGRTPVRMIGPPLLARVGVRLRLGAR